MDSFFDQYPDFDRPSTLGLIASFRALSVSQRWAPDDQHDARRSFRAAMVQEFNNRYGTNEKDLESWRNLCRVFEISDELLGSITKCKKELAKIHVNLVDLIELPMDSSGPTTPVRVFPTVKELRKYTRNKKKYFPRDQAKQGGILKCLLREIFR